MEYVSLVSSSGIIIVRASITEEDTGKTFSYITVCWSTYVRTIILHQINGVSIVPLKYCSIMKTHNTYVAKHLCKL